AAGLLHAEAHLREVHIAPDLELVAVEVPPPRVVARGRRLGLRIDPGDGAVLKSRVVNVVREANFIPRQRGRRKRNGSNARDDSWRLHKSCSPIQAPAGTPAIREIEKLRVFRNPLIPHWGGLPIRPY